MEGNDLVQRSKLDVNFLGDRYRETVHATTEAQQETVTKIWQRKRALAYHVYLEESQFGELRAIKQVHSRDVRSDLRELQVMGRVTEVWLDYQTGEKIMILPAQNWQPRFLSRKKSSLSSFSDGSRLRIIFLSQWNIVLSATFPRAFRIRLLRKLLGICARNCWRG